MTAGRLERASFELGLNSFGEVATDDGRVLSDAETIRLIVEEARLAEAVGPSRGPRPHDRAARPRGRPARARTARDGTGPCQTSDPEAVAFRAGRHDT